MPLEAEARQEIDRQLAACGWAVQDYVALNLAAAPGIAVREFPLTVGEVDYLLYVDGKAAGVVEAKRDGELLISVEHQSSDYSTRLPPAVPCYHRPLPFIYESTGKQTRFTNTREPDFRSRLVFTFHRPEELLRLAQAESPLRAALRTMPPLNPAGLWTVQESAIRNLERSIYNLWRQVLDYFDAFLIGLTATPSAQTIGFFNQNLVERYTHEKAVADGVNVGYDVYTINTRITAQGARLAAEPGRFIPHRDRRTKDTIHKELDDDVTYHPGQLDRDVVARDQIRLVLQTFRDRLFTEIFPGRTEVPKTLIFAKNDQHAEDIVEEARQVFGKGNEFCQKITSKAKKPKLLQQFRTTFYPRIAVTVDMIATGTDVKPLECLLFMRNINSSALVRP